MAFSAPNWEVRTGGLDSNGGGFDTGATFVADGAATVATSAAPVFTSASYTFVAGDVGAWVFIKSGSNWIPGWYKITGISGTGAILDATIGHAPLYAALARGFVRGLSIATGCATTASPTVGTWGIDYSQQDGSQITLTDMVIDATTNTKFTSVLKPVGKNYIGNIINVTSGTGFTVQRVAVLSTSGTTATCDKSLGTLSSTGGHGTLGGGFLTPGAAAALVGTVSGGFWIQSGAYSITSASTNIANGCVAIATSIARCEGFATYHGDMGTAPVLTASGVSTATIFSVSGSTGQVVRNITIDGGSGTAVRGLLTSGDNCENVVVKNCTNTGFYFNSSNIYVLNCVCTGCTTVDAFGGIGVNQKLVGCVSYNNQVVGFNCGGSTVYIFCISAGNSGTSDGWNLVNEDICINCVAYNNGRDGFRASTSSTAMKFINCVAEGHAAGWGFNAPNTNSFAGVNFNSCATYNNNSGAINTTTFGNFYTNLIVGGASFFTNPGSNDFSLNANNPGGAQLRGTGFPGIFGNALGSTGYIDIGAVQAPYAAPGFAGGSAVAIFGS